MRCFMLEQFKKTARSSAIHNQKSTLIRIMLIFLMTFCFFMAIYYYFKENMPTFYTLLLLLCIYGIEYILIHFIDHTSKNFAIGALLTLTVFVFYILHTPGQCIETIWFWFLAFPSLTIYVCSIFWSVAVILYGQVILIVLLWTPLSAQILTPQTMFLNRLPVIYFVISISCLAISYTIFQYQLKKEEDTNLTVTELTQTIEQRRIDRMTNLLTRDFAIEPIEEVLEEGFPCAFVLMDIDNFKLINDLHGHAAGDETLSKFASLLKDVFPPSTILVRYGGDEFIAVIPDFKSLEILRDILDQLLDRVKDIVDDDYLKEKIGVSIGVSLSPKDGGTFFKLSSNADKAQYYAKRNGKNRYSFYSNAPATDDQKNIGATIETIRRMVQSVWMKKGAFTIEYGNFGTIYHFLERNLSRNKQQTEILLFTILQNDTSNAAQQHSIIYDTLCEHIQTSLRTTDLLLKFSRNQILVLLVNCNAIDAKIVVSRILDSYREDTILANADISYELGSIHEVGSVDSPNNNK